MKQRTSTSESTVPMESLNQHLTSKILTEAQTSVPPYLKVIVQSRPPGIGAKAFISEVSLLLRGEEVSGRIFFKGIQVLMNGTKCYSFMGMCPIHKRHHDHATWQLQLNGKYSYWKCFRDNSTKKTIYLINLC